MKECFVSLSPPLTYLSLASMFDACSAAKFHRRCPAAQATNLLHKQPAMEGSAEVKSRDGRASLSKPHQKSYQKVWSTARNSSRSPSPQAKQWESSNPASAIALRQARAPTPKRKLPPIMSSSLSVSAGAPSLLSDVYMYMYMY